MPYKNSEVSQVCIANISILCVFPPNRAKGCMVAGIISERGLKYETYVDRAVCMGKPFCFSCIQCVMETGAPSQHTEKNVDRDTTFQSKYKNC